MTAYREGELIRRAIGSLQRQTDRDFGITVVEDASPDALTRSILDAYSREGTIQLIRRTENGGLSAARNSGFAATEEDLVVILDSDDELPERAIEEIRAVFDADPALDFLLGDYEIISVESGAARRESCADLAEPASGLIGLQRVMANYKILGTSPLKRSLWQRLGGYDQAFSYDNQDIDFWLRVLESGARGKYLDALIYRWYKADSGMNRNLSGDRMLDLYEKHIALIRHSGSESIWQKIVLAPYLKAADWTGLKRASARLMQANKPLSPASLLYWMPVFLLRFLYKSYRARKKP